MKSRRGRNVFKILRNIHNKDAVVPLDAEKHQAQACTSKEKPQSKIRVLPQRVDSATSDKDEGKSPLRGVKVAPKRSRHGSNVLTNMHRNGSLLNVDTEVCEFIHDTCEKKTKDNIQVLPECPDDATLPKNNEKAPVEMGKVPSKKCRCGSAILKKIYRKRIVVPGDIRKSQDLPSTSRQRAHVSRQEVPENADAAPSAGAQGEPPVGKDKEETKNRRHSMYYRIY